MLCPIAGVICLKNSVGQKIKPYEAGRVCGRTECYSACLLQCSAVIYLQGMNESNDGTRLTLAY